MGSLLEKTRYAGSGIVFDNSWHIFGGYETTITKSQKLDITANTWSEGIGLYEAKKNFGHCVLLVIYKTIYMYHTCMY
jgi:hypothetical protein